MNTDRTKQTNFIVILLFGGSVLLRFLLGNFYPRTVNCYPDEMLYYSAAESLWNNHQIMVYNLPSDFSKIGYSLMIAPVFAIADIRIRLTAIALVNAGIISLGVFPVYGLANRILSDRRRTILCVFLYTISPTLTYSMTYMSEVLYVPLALGILYLMYCLIAEENYKKKASIIVGLVIAVCGAYVTKSQALVFPVALLLCYVTDGILGKKKWPRVISWGIIIAGCVGIATVMITGRLGKEWILLCERWRYVLFSFIFYLLITLIAFMYIPVVFPGLRYQLLDKKTRRFYLYLLWLVLVTAFVVACMIYVKEDYPSMTLRAHIRYIEFAFVPFVIIFLRTMEMERKEKLTWGHWVGFAIFTGVLLLVFQGFSGQTMDHTMLFYWQLLAEGGTTFLPYKVRIFSGILLIILVILFIIYNRNRNIFQKIMVCGIVIACLGNSILSVFVQYKTHTHTIQETAEAERIREFVCQHEQEAFLLYEPDGFDELLDTFLVDCENLSVKLTTEDVSMMKSGNKTSRDVAYIILHEEMATNITDTDIQLVGTYPNLRYAVYKTGR